MSNFCVRTAEYKITIVLLILLGSLKFISCQEEHSLDNNVILDVEDTRIDLRDFRFIYESDPSFPGYKRGYDGLLEYAETLSDQILAHKLAKEEGIFKTDPLKKYLRYAELEKTIRAFYNQEVGNKIRITDAELREAYKKMSVRLRVKHLFAPTKQKADELYTDLQMGIPFDTLARSVFKNVDPSQGSTDLGEITWGDLEKNIEEAVFRLEPKQFSTPVNSRWGYHILLVTERKQKLLLTEDEFVKKYRLIKNQVKIRKETEVAGEYLKNFLDPMDIKIKTNAYNKLINILRMNSDLSQRTVIQQFLPFDDEVINKIEIALENDLDESLMTSKNEIWSIENFLDKIKNLPEDKRPDISSAARFKNDIGLLIRNEFIYKKALDEGIENKFELDSTVNEYKRKLAYEHYRNRFYQAYQIPDPIARYYRREPGDYAGIDTTILRGMTSIEHYRMYYASKKLRQFLRKKFPEIEVFINKKLIWQESERINWNHPVRIFIPNQ
jgi:hypothetical protein